ncbi:MAG TPA: DUF58 domain-containing protein [Anaerolineales bacterium]|nr:DUF58 domain-containing protein [Anaerolineales bacterium]
MVSRARVVLALFVISLIGARVTGRDLFYSLTYLWGTLLVVAYIWSRTTLSGVTIVREPRSNRAQVGQLFIERFTLSNLSRITKLWVETKDTSDLPGYRVTTVSFWLGLGDTSDMGERQSVTVASGFGRGQTRRWMTRTLCTRRGRYRLGPMTLRSSDPFGIFPRTHEIPTAHHVVVLPMIVPLEGFPIPSGRLPGGEALRRRTHQITPNASGVRDYAPGDSFSRIHWRSTARLRKLIVKEFELDPLAEIWIIVDAALSPHFELQQSDERAKEKDEGIFQLPPSTIEYGVTAAASLAMHFLQRNRAVGFIAYGAARQVIQPEPGEAQRLRLLESLAVLNAVGNNSLQDVIKIEGSRIPQGATAIFITPSISTDMLAGVRRLRHTGRQPVLVLLDAASFGGPEGSQTIGEAARRSGIAVRTLSYGDSLGEALGSPTHSHRAPRIA